MPREITAYILQNKPAGVNAGQMGEGYEKIVFPIARKFHFYGRTAEKAPDYAYLD